MFLTISGVVFWAVVIGGVIAYYIFKVPDERKTPHEQMKDFWDERRKRFDNFTS
jgi:hypothetical protein